MHSSVVLRGRKTEGLWVEEVVSEAALVFEDWYILQGYEARRRVVHCCRSGMVEVDCTERTAAEEALADIRTAGSALADIRNPVEEDAAETAWNKCN